MEEELAGARCVDAIGFVHIHMPDRTIERGGGHPPDVTP